MLFCSITLSFYLINIETFEQDAKMHIAGDNMSIALTQVLYYSVYQDTLRRTSQRNIFSAQTYLRFFACKLFYFEQTDSKIVAYSVKVFLPFPGYLL